MYRARRTGFIKAQKKDFIKDGKMDQLIWRQGQVERLVILVSSWTKNRLTDLESRQTPLSIVNRSLVCFHQGEGVVLCFLFERFHLIHFWQLRLSELSWLKKNWQIASELPSWLVDRLD